MQYTPRLRSLRLAQELTLEDVSIQLGIAISTLGFYETGVIDIPVSRLYQLANFYNVTFNDILVEQSHAKRQSARQRSHPRRDATTASER